MFNILDRTYNRSSISRTELAVALQMQVVLGQPTLVNQAFDREKEVEDPAAATELEGSVDEDSEEEASEEEEDSDSEEEASEEEDSEEEVPMDKAAATKGKRKRKTDAGKKKKKKGGKKKKKKGKKRKRGKKIAKAMTIAIAAIVPTALRYFTTNIVTEIAHILQIPAVTAEKSVAWVDVIQHLIEPVEVNDFYFIDNYYTFALNCPFW